MSNTISEKIVLMRKSEYLSRQQLADLTGVPYGTLSYYESGRSTSNRCHDEHPADPTIHQIHFMVHDQPDRS